MGFMWKMSVVPAGIIGTILLMFAPGLGALPSYRHPARATGPAHILSLKVSYRFEDGGPYTRTTRTRYRILDRQGVEGWAHVSVIYVPTRMKRPVIRVRVTNPDGGEYALDEKAITERPAHEDTPEIYSDALELRAPIPSVRVGTVIDEEIIEQIDGRFFQGSVSHSMSFQTGVARDEVELQIDVPAAMPLQYQIREAEVQKSDETQGGRRRLIFRGGPYAGLEALESGAPDEIPRWPGIIFSTGRSWRDLATEYYNRVRPILESPAPDGVELPPADGPLADRVNRLLTQLNSRVRYVGLEFGEGAIIPGSPSETLARGYGDCKDKATLLISVLNRAGVPARLVLLRTGPGEDVVEGLPALNVFDHAIVYIPGQRPLWVDPTSPFARAGELPVSDRGRLALIADPATSVLVRTPVGNPEENSVTETREVRMADQGPGVIVETTISGGLMDQGLRQRLAVEEVRTRKNLEEYALKSMGAKSVGRIEHGNPMDLSSPLRLMLEAKEVATARTDLLSARVSLNERVLFGWIPDAAFEESERQLDFIVPFPHQVELRYVVIPAPGYRVSKLPDFPELDLGPVQLKRQATAGDDGKAVVTLSVSVRSTRWTTADLDRFRKGLQELRREDADVVGMEHISEHLINSHQEAAAIRLLRGDQAGQARSGLDSARMALHLMDMGLGIAARNAADAAVRQMPENAMMHRVRGMVWMRDEFGRVFKPGYGREEAISSFRQVLKLKADDVFARIMLAVLLEYNEAGERYRDRRALEEAVRQYDAIDQGTLDEYQNGDYSSNAIFALMWGNRFAEVRQRLRKRTVSRTPPVPAIVSEALLNGVQAGMKEADRLNLKGEERSRAFQDVVDVLIQQRRYAVAAELLQRAAGEGRNAEASVKRAETLQRLAPVHPLELPSATPAEAVRRLLMLQFVGHRVFRPVSEALIAISARSQESGVRRFLASFSDRGKSGDLPTDVLADIITSFLKITQEGDDAGGYRVRVILQPPGGERKEVLLFVIYEEGMYRVRATGEDLRDVGQQAYAFARNNNRRAAERWLSWAAEIVESSHDEDPLSIPAWVALMRSAAGPESSEVAAAALCAKTCGAEGLRSIVASVPSRVGSDRRDTRTGAGREPWRYEQLLASAYLDHAEYALALQHVSRLGGSFPASGVVKGMLFQALSGARRYADIRQLLEKELAATPVDQRTALETELLNVDAMMGQMDRVKASCGRLLASGKGPARVYNSCAWMGLFADGASDSLLQWAREGDRLTKGKSPAVLHTLAVIYAELGRFSEAKETLMKLLDERPVKEDDWYIVGRLSEKLGLMDAAELAYRKIKIPERPSPTSTFELLRRNSRPSPLR